MFIEDPKHCVEKVLSKVGKKIVLATPLGLGKPIQFLNALYIRVKSDPSLELTIISALSFTRPRAQNNLAARFLDPFVERVYGDYEDLLYELDRRAECLPPNVKVIEFFLTAGYYLNNSTAQQDFIYSNYTYVIRDILSYNINIMATMVAASQDLKHLSLSCNVDLTKDLLKACPKALLIGQINNNLPYMYGFDAEISVDKFFFILKNPDCDRKLFSLPKQALNTQDYLIGLYASTLIRDDGCLQIGIGNLNDALIYALILRHSKNKFYQEILEDLQDCDIYTSVFSEGLFALTEMLVDGYLELYKTGILKKYLSRYVAHAGFFVGSNAFYQQLRDMPESERQRFSMRSISEINQLYGDEFKRREERKNSSFVNTCLKATLMGEIISDSLYNGLTISGVGGQYNFVAMANELKDARSIMLCRSYYQKGHHVESNIIFNYGPSTLPRHLRDIVVTEYGIAYLRGKTDKDIIKNMLNVSDSRFQNSLLKQAKNAKKLPENYEIPVRYKNNFPAKTAQFFEKQEFKDLFLAFPFGSEFDTQEMALINILDNIKNSSKMQKIKIILKGLIRSPSVEQKLVLKRMNLTKINSMRELVYRSLLLGASKF